VVEPVSVDPASGAVMHSVTAYALFDGTLVLQVDAAAAGVPPGAPAMMVHMIRAATTTPNCNRTPRPRAATAPFI
jgi:hypothetical protein